MPVILTTQEAEIRRIMLQSQPWQIVLEILSQKKPSQKRVSIMASPSTAKKKKKVLG
jgi:hypothetical protein